MIYIQDNSYLVSDFSIYSQIFVKSFLAIVCEADFLMYVLDYIPKHAADPTFWIK